MFSSHERRGIPFSDSASLSESACAIDFKLSISARIAPPSSSLSCSCRLRSFSKLVLQVIHTPFERRARQRQDHRACRAARLRQST